MSESHAPEGYVLCVGCQEALVLDLVARRTRNLCVDCLLVNGGPLEHVEIETGGTVVQIPTRPHKNRDRGAKTAEAKRRERIVDACKTRAMRRLKNVFPDLYAIFLAEERATVGLDPWPLQNAADVDVDPDGQVTAEFARLYHALDERGVSL